MSAHTTPASPVSTRAAATLMLVRDEPGFEILMVKRHHQVDFASGAMVFPGGKVSAEDEDPGWAGHAFGWEGVPAEERALRIAAIRETFEEAAILLCRGERSVAWSAGPQALEARQAMARGELSFLDAVRAHGLMLDLAGLVPFARWVTPDFMPKRFDTVFFLASAPPDQLAAIDGWEIVDTEWLAPADALRLAAEGTRTIIFPTRMNLQLLAEVPTVQAAMEAARARPVVTVQPRVVEREGKKFLTLPPDAGYGAVAEPIPPAGPRGPA